MTPDHAGDQNYCAQNKSNFSGGYTEDVMLLIPRGEETDTRHEYGEERRVARESGRDVKVKHPLHSAHNLFVRNDHEDEVLGHPQEEERQHGYQGKELRCHTSLIL